MDSLTNKQGTLLWLCAIYFTSLLQIIGGEPTYDIKFQKMEIYETDKSPDLIVKYASIERYNRTLIISNVSVLLTTNISSDAICSVEGWEKMGVDYGKSTLGIPPTSCCELMEKEYWLYPTMVDASNLPLRCPVEADLYNVLNLYVDSNKLPDDIPGGDEWRFDIRITVGGADIYFVGVYVCFDRTEYRRKQAQGGGGGEGPPGGPRGR